MTSAKTSSDEGNEFARAFSKTLAERPDAPFLWLPREGAGELGESLGTPCEPGILRFAGLDACGSQGPSSGEGRVDLVSLTYAQVDELACRLTAALATRGVREGDLVPVDLANGPLFVGLMLAASRMGFALVTLNARLSTAEKRLRLAGLEAALGRKLPTPLSADDLAACARGAAGDAGASCAAPSVPGGATAVVMFTSGTTGTPKAVPLSWDNLCGSARAFNARLATRGEGLWQATLPMYHVGGLQILVRSVLNETPLALYGRFDAPRVLRDAEVLDATHLSVVDKTLRDLLDADDTRAQAGLPRVLPRYACLLLGGSVPNPVTLRRSVAAGARVWASFGMTETASNVASAPVTDDFDGWLDLLDGYEAHVVGADGGVTAGTGQLAVAGPGVMGGYLNATTPRTPDGLLLTGDMAEMRDGRIRVGERTGDMFVSGGENVYPAEIENALLELPGVRDAYVFGTPDPMWGRRPVAFVEAPAAPSADPAPLCAEHLRGELCATLSKLNRPERLYVLGELPRVGIGKIDRAALRARDAARLEVARVDVWRIEQPLRTPFVTARTTMRARTSAIVRVTDRAGHVGLGECVSFPTPWYLPETLGEDLAVLCERLIPLVVGQPLLDPWQAEELLASCPEARTLPMARAALENALWDLWARVRGVPLWRVLREQVGASDAAGCTDGLTATSVRVPAGIVVGIGSVCDTLGAVQSAVEAGYTRVKLKVRPGDDVERVRAVRRAYPDLMLTLDANQSYTEDDLPALRALGELDIRCIEEPLDPGRAPAGDCAGLFELLESLQGQLSMPVCLDESLTCADDAWRVLRDHPSLRCFALKIGKFGGVGPALRFYREARQRGAEVWMGGMYETSISKRLHAAFETLPGAEIPGDLSATSRYFLRDIAAPELTVERGLIELNTPGHPSGLGCELDEGVVAGTCVEHRVFEAEG